MPLLLQQRQIIHYAMGLPIQVLPSPHQAEQGIWNIPKTMARTMLAQEFSQDLQQERTIG